MADLRVWGDPRVPETAPIRRPRRPRRLLPALLVAGTVLAVVSASAGPVAPAPVPLRRAPAPDHVWIGADPRTGAPVYARQISLPFTDVGGFTGVTPTVAPVYDGRHLVIGGVPGGDPVTALDNDTGDILVRHAAPEQAAGWQVRYTFLADPWLVVVERRQLADGADRAFRYDLRTGQRVSLPGHGWPAPGAPAGWSVRDHTLAYTTGDSSAGESCVVLADLDTLRWRIRSCAGAGWRLDDVALGAGGFVVRQHRDGGCELRYAETGAVEAPVQVASGACDELGGGAVASDWVVWAQHGAVWAWPGGGPAVLLGGSAHHAPVVCGGALFWVAPSNVPERAWLVRWGSGPDPAPEAFGDPVPATVLSCAGSWLTAMVRTIDGTRVAVELVARAYRIG